MAKKYNFGNPFKKGNIYRIWIKIANPKTYPLFPDEPPGKAVIWFRNGNIKGERTIRAESTCNYLNLNMLRVFLEPHKITLDVDGGII